MLWKEQTYKIVYFGLIFLHKLCSGSFLGRKQKKY